MLRQRVSSSTNSDRVINGNLSDQTGDNKISGKMKTRQRHYTWSGIIKVMRGRHISYINCIKHLF